MPHSLSVQTPSSVDPTMNLQWQRFFSVFPLSSRCYFQPWFGSRIPARPSMKSPDFDLPLHLLLNRRRFCRHPSATASSTEAVDAVSALGRPPHLLPGSRSRFRLRFGSPVPALDSWTKSPLSVECLPLSQAGEVTLRFRSAVLSSTEAVDAFTLLSLPVTSPAELRLALSFLRISFFGLAEDQSP